MPDTFKPVRPIRGNQVLSLERDNPFEWTFTPRVPFPFGASGYLTFKNTAGQTVDTWEADAGSDGTLPFFEETAATNAIPAGTAWTLTVDLNDGNSPRLFEWGSVNRNESPFPDAPENSDIFDGVRYGYTFGTAGKLTDPAWRILNGHPHVYDNSLLTLPNAVGAGSLVQGDLAVYDDVAMLYFAQTRGDFVRVTYNTIRIGFAGTCEMWVVLCSDYGMTNSAAIYHKMVFGFDDTIGIATGTGPVTYATRASTTHTTTTNQNFTAEYNPASNTFAVYVGTNLTPLVTWVDSTDVVDHDIGNRYIGFAFKSGLVLPGIEVSDWLASDSV